MVKLVIYTGALAMAGMVLALHSSGLSHIAKGLCVVVILLAAIKIYGVALSVVRERDLDRQR